MRRSYRFVASAPAERFVRGSRLLYNLFRIRQHLFENFFARFCRNSALRFRQRRHSSKGGESYNRFPFRQHPGSKIFRFPMSATPEGCSLVARSNQPINEGGESYNQFPFRQHPRNNFLRAAHDPERPPFAVPHHFGLARGRAANPTTNLRSVKPFVRAFLCRQYHGEADGPTPPPSARARTNACRSAADARRRPPAPARGPQRRRRRCAPHAH